MRDILRKAKPQRLDDLIALNALYRPGPLRSGMVDDFIARKQGKTEVKYELPQLEPILADTYGVIAYQEQVMRIAHVARRLHARRGRRAAQGDGQEEPRGHGRRCAASSSTARKKQRASTRRRPRSIFDLMEHFAGYGFNKSHSTAYAFLAYQTAYLKANYPWHFAAALLTIEAQNTDKLALYLGECRERGIPVLPPDINESQLRFTVEPEGRPLRPDRDQERRRRRDRVAAGASRAKQRPDHVAARALRRSRPAARQQARVREPGQGGRVRFAGARDPACDGAADAALRAAADRRARCRRASTARACSAIASEGRRSCSAASDERGGDGRGRPTAAARGARRGPRPSSSLREGNARPVLERPSGRPLRRRAEGVRRADDRRAGRRAGRRPRGRRLGARAAASRSSPTPASAASSPPAGS